MLRKRALAHRGAWPWHCVVLAVAAYAYDSSRDDRIAEGVTVAGVDVGGMRADAAASKLPRERSGPASSARCACAVAGRRFKLTAERAHLVADIDGMVDEAVDRSRDGVLPVRVWPVTSGRRGDRAGAAGDATRRVAVNAVRAARAQSGQPAGAGCGRQVRDRRACPRSPRETA